MVEKIKLDEITPALDAKGAERMITKNLPPIDHHSEVVEHVGRNTIRVRLPYKSEFMGQVFSGPMVMGLADTAMYCCVMAVMGADVMPAQCF